MDSPQILKVKYDYLMQLVPMLRAAPASFLLALMWKLKEVSFYPLTLMLVGRHANLVR